MAIRSRDEWVEVLETNWPDLEKIIEKYIDPKSLTSSVPLLIARKPVRAVRDDIDHAWKDCDWQRLKIYLQEAWWRAPDEPTIHNETGWDVLCELLTEDWVLGH